MNLPQNSIPEFRRLLSEVQEYISKYCSTLITTEKNKENDELLKAYIGQYIRKEGADIPGIGREELVGRIYSEMAEYSILTAYLDSSDIEEINVNGWDDIALTLRDGRVVKAPEHFFSPGHAEDIVRRLLRHSGMILDSATPMSQGHLPGNNRITALKAPLIDGERGVAVSIRLLHNNDFDLRTLIKSGMASPEMAAFLRMLCRYGVSFVIAGATSSGKTTLLNAVLEDMPDGKRIFTIESGARELSLLRRDSTGRVTNNVVHTISRPSDNEKQNICQEDLVVASLRYNPDIVCVGEMRDVECYAAVEAAMTGHTVVSTVHSGASEAAHMRIALLCQKKFPIDFSTSMLQAAEAFPVVVYCGRPEDGKRRIMDISECVSDYSDGSRKYRRLFGYEIGWDGAQGRFVTGEPASAGLKKRLAEHGAPGGLLSQFNFVG
ncbi:MAG: CpaF/VirB11 family protein [Clostridia bacterium]|nr:CpaF/VirB11 family protein [Clostridia bacterium]